MMLGMLSLSGTHATYPVIGQTKASDMRSGSIHSAGGKWKPGSDPVCSGDGLLIVQINSRICARDRYQHWKAHWMRGGLDARRQWRKQKFSW